MFSGIVQTKLVLQEINKQTDFASLVYTFPAPMAQGLKLGASVAQNGVCLTVRTLNEHSDGSATVSFDAIAQTLKLTNLSDLTVGDAVKFIEGKGYTVDRKQSEKTYDYDPGERDFYPRIKFSK